MRFIVAAAMNMDGLICIVEQPGHHHDIIAKLSKAGVPKPRGGQGFLTNEGTFVNRSEAAEIAAEAGQIKPERREKRAVIEKGPVDLLYTEDLW